MAERNPLVWLWLLAVLASMAVTTHSPVLLLVMTGAVLVAGFQGYGPRSDAFRVALALALLAAAYWVVLTLLMPGASSGTTVLDRPVWAPGPGIRFGGPLTDAGITGGLVGALKAIVCLTALGIAWQEVGGRAWQATARAVLGNAVDAVAPWCHLGDAAQDSVQAQDRAARDGWPRPGVTGWLSGWLFAARTAALATPVPRGARSAAGTGTGTGAGSGALWLRTLLLIVAGIGPIVALAAGWHLPGPLRRISATDLVVVWLLILVLVAALTPSADRRLLRLAQHDLPILGAAALVTAAWFGWQVSGGSATGWTDVPLVPMAAVLVVPLAVMATAGAARQRGPRAKGGRRA